MIDGVKKLFKIIQEFKNHPITEGKEAKALFNYYYFAIASELKKDLIYKWIGDLKFYVQKQDYGMVFNIYFGLHEVYESAFLLHFLRKSDTFLDIGANLGHFSLLASGLSECKSIAIKPIPATFIKLKKQINLNKLVEKISPLNIGISNISSELSFSTDKGTMNKVVSDEYNHAIKIPVKTVDELNIFEEINLIKIDVEGYEKHVLQGAEKVIKNKALNAIIIEINGSGKFYNIENEEVCKYIISKGFLPYKYDLRKRALIRLKIYNKNQFNTIFIRDLNFVTQRLQNGKNFEVWDKLF